MLALVVNFHPELRRRARLLQRPMRHHPASQAPCDFEWKITIGSGHLAPLSSTFRPSNVRTCQRLLDPISFTSNYIPTLLPNGALLSLFFSCTSALFSIQRRGCPFCLPKIEEQHESANS